ncbi:MAG: BtpA/SgcQ family protein [Planctomycetes bacterium]|nr:BtpA/SgcQ family protein [Planctomycetota bacterium]MCB9903466.1 BtpA/SgcQ family protein [Planctomycetota bacterium]
MDTKRRIFEQRGTLIGMVHVQALPGTPYAVDSLDVVVERAVRDARCLVDAGFEALIVENMHDRPYLRGAVGPEIVSALTRVTLAVRDVAQRVPLGVQVLAGANEAALAVALAASADFVRVEGFVFASVADEGLLDEAAAGKLLRYRRAIGGDHLAVFADVKKKHSAHALTADVPLDETARAAFFCGADGVIVTGVATGSAADPDDLAAVRKAVGDAPVLVGSGVTPANASDFVAASDGLIIGSSTKQHGDWRRDVDPDRAKDLVTAVQAARRA